MKTKRSINFLILAAGVLFGLTLSAADSSRPNILWIIIDDMSANFSSYGETLIETPHVDRLAANGVKFTKAFVTAPVCSTNRSAFITGMYQTSIGAHHHRSGRGKLKIHLPDGIRPIPELFQEAGYYTAITGWPNRDRTSLGKTDYNFEWDSAMYDGPDWSKRKSGQPFFAQIHLPGGKHRARSLESFRKLAARVENLLGSKTDSAKVKLPPYYPNDPVILEDWAAYLDTVRLTDKFVGDIIGRLKEEGDYENTVVLFMTDHGISHARGKQFLYEEGLHVPLVIAGPTIKAGQVRDDLVEHIDIAALSLGLAGIDIPEYMQAKDILSKDYKKRTTIFAARDRCDETVEHLRGLRTARYKYIRNFLPNRPHLQPNRYKDGKDIIKALREAHAAGTLNKTQELLFTPTRPEEELYDLKNDPFEIHNLAADPKHQTRLKNLRKRLDNWMKRTNDHGPESEAMYDSDMAVYINAEDDDPEQRSVLTRNIALMKKWAAEGK
ncbi:sulfatase [Acidobacteria bacterium AH-259-L09]|nr:sulfatase [Acidobacteria bacterium AH-259-L09]